MLRALPGVVLVLLLTGCTGALEEASGPDPEPVAEALADGLAAGDFADVPVAGDGAAAASEELAGIVEGMGEVAAAVCQPGVVNCAPPGTGNSSHLVVSPRLSDGSVTTADNRKRFYVVVSGDSSDRS